MNLLRTSVPNLDHLLAQAELREYFRPEDLFRIIDCGQWRNQLGSVVDSRELGANQSIAREAGAPEHYAGKLLARFPNEEQRDRFAVLIHAVDDATRRRRSWIGPTLAFEDQFQLRDFFFMSSRRTPKPRPAM